MYRQREKYEHISYLALILAMITTFVAILKSYYLLVLFSLFLVSISLIAEALLLHMFHRQIESIKHLVRAILIIVLITFLFIKF